MIELFHNNQLCVTLEPVQISEYLLSVAFDIKASFNMPFQNTTIYIKECWFEHSSLNQFEFNLRELLEIDSGVVILRNMSEMPIITIERTTSTTIFKIVATDTANMGKVELVVNGYALEIKEILDKLREYPKWW